MKTKFIRVVVRLEVEDYTNVDIEQMIHEMDYSFVYPNIVDTEIVEVLTETGEN